MEAMDTTDSGLAFQALVLIRWLHFSAIFIFFGAAFFGLYARALFADARRATARLLHVAAPVAFLSGLGWLVAQIAAMAGGFDQLADPDMLGLFFFQPPFGRVASARILLLAAALPAAFAPLNLDARLRACCGVGALLLVNQAWLGHAAEGGDNWRGAAMIASYSIHVLAAAAWVGGLAPLLVILRAARRRPPDEGFHIAREALDSFSRMAIIAVAAIVLTGAANVAFHGGLPPGRLTHSSYGAILAIKSALVAAMLVCALYNRLVAMPALSAGEEAAWPGLRLSISLELALGMLVLAAAAVLGATPHPP